MTSARDLMTADPDCVETSETLVQAAEKMQRLGVGALPICGPDRRLKGMLTDRDIVVRGIAAGKTPDQTIAGDLNQGEAVTIGADDSVEQTMATMIEHEVKRLPVIDGDQLVGVITVADVARGLPNPDTGQLVEALSLG